MPSTIDRFPLTRDICRPARDALRVSMSMVNNSGGGGAVPGYMLFACVLLARSGGRARTSQPFLYRAGSNQKPQPPGRGACVCNTSTLYLLRWRQRKSVTKLARLHPTYKRTSPPAPSLPPTPFDFSICISHSPTTTQQQNFGFHPFLLTQ